MKRVFIYAVFSVFFSVVVYSYTGETGFIEPSLESDADIQFFSGYETYDGVNDSSWKSAWGMEFESNPEHHSITASDVLYGNYSARVIYPAGTYSSPGGSQHLNDFSLFPTAIAPRESMYARYYVRFDPDFEFVKGGKLPGLCGGACNTGGDQPDGTDGWSARIMWRGNGKIVQYLYHMDQPTIYGEDLDWNYGGCERYFIPGKWHCVETYIQMNTPGQHDGVIRSWLDGELALERTDIRYRDTGYSNIQIDHFYFSTFFGGGDSTWAPSKDEHSQFDNFILSDSYIGECTDCTIPPAPTPVPTAELVEESSVLVYDGDNPGWSSFGWGGTYDNADSSMNNTPGGAYSANINYDAGSWGAFAFDVGSTAFDVSPYNYLEFYINPSGCNTTFRVVHRNTSGVDVGNEIVVSGSPAWFPATGGWDTGNWNLIRIPMADFGLTAGEAADIDRLLIKSDSDQGTDEFNIDDVRFVNYSESANTPTETETFTHTDTSTHTETQTETSTHTET
ncbi:MAG: polysaccharide lyase, partial [Candidatus Goldiibacteriota bacterium]